MKKAITLSVESEVYEAAQARAITEGGKISNIVELLLKKYIENGL